MPENPVEDYDAPLPWVSRWSNLVPAGARVLDLACGRGRHTRLFAQKGCVVTAVDRDQDALLRLGNVMRVHVVEADLEAEPWPFEGNRFDAIIVTRYLHRPLYVHLLNTLESTGILIYETFALGNEVFGKPSNPNFLLRPHELLEVVRNRLAVIAFEQGRTTAPHLAVVQRLCAAGLRYDWPYPLPD